MNSHLVLTFIGNDRPGLVGQLSSAVTAHGGNWLESRMSRLAGKFAGIARVSVPAAEAEALATALRGLHTDGLVVTVETGHSQTDAPADTVTLGILGPDRPGIVREVSQALHARQINVDDMHSDVVSAPMTAEALFIAQATLRLPAGTDRIALQDTLAAIGDRLGVEITLDD